MDTHGLCLRSGGRKLRLPARRQRNGGSLGRSLRIGRPLQPCPETSCHDCLSPGIQNHLNDPVFRNDKIVKRYLRLHYKLRGPFGTRLFWGTRFYVQFALENCRAGGWSIDRHRSLFRNVIKVSVEPEDYDKLRYRKSRVAGGAMRDSKHHLSLLNTHIGLLVPEFCSYILTEQAIGHTRFDHAAIALMFSISWGTIIAPGAPIGA